MIFQLEDLFISADDFEVHKERQLGEGSWAAAYIARRLSDNKQFVAKIYKTFGKNDQKLIMRAALANQILEHPAILKFYGISFHSLEDPYIFEPTIILEYMPNGTLRDILDKERNGLANENWSTTKKYIILLGIAHAMKYMNEKGFIHRDIKPENILLDANYYPQISGFTLCRIFPHPLKKSMEMEMSTGIGTPLYMAPEILKNDNDEYGIAVDVYSFSILAYELVTGNAPYDDTKSFIRLFTDVLKGLRPTFSDDVTQPMKDLISRCWNEDPDERPSFDEIYDLLANDYNSFFHYDLDEDEIQEYIDTLNQQQQ